MLIDEWECRYNGKECFDDINYSPLYLQRGKMV